MTRDKIIEAIEKFVGEDKYKDMGYTNKEIFVFEGINKEKARLRKNIPNLADEILSLTQNITNKEVE